MLEIFEKGPWYSTFITAKYEYSIQNSLFVKSKFARNGRQVPPVDASSIGINSKRANLLAHLFFGFYFRSHGKKDADGHPN